MSSRNKEKLPICRIASLKGFGGVIIGRDLGGILKEGHVYDVRNILDTMVISDLGEHAEAKFLRVGTIGHHAISGIPMLTKEEYAKQLEKDKE